jgi:serine/threonine protein kinase
VTLYYFSDHKLSFVFNIIIIEWYCSDEHEGKEDPFPLLRKIMYPGNCDPRNIFRFDDDAILDVLTRDWTMEDFENGRIHWTFQDFEFGKVLGTGGFGRVYLVRERKSMCVVALKVIKNFQEREVACQHLFTSGEGNEGKAPNVFGYFHTKKYVCLIVEYAPGGNLSQILNHSLSEGKIACIMHQLCDIISFMHRMNILHPASGHQAR